MILCDLPYGTTACKWDTIILFDKLWEQYNRIIKDNGAIVLFGSQPFTSLLINSNIKHFKHEWIWEKQKAANFMSAKYAPLKYHEEIIVFSGNSNKVSYNPIKYKVLEFKDIENLDKNELKKIFDTRDYDRYGKVDKRKTVNDVVNPKDSHYGALKLKELGVDKIYAYASHTENSILDKEKGTLIKLLEDGTVERLFTTSSLFTGKHEKITVL